VRRHGFRGRKAQEIAKPVEDTQAEPAPDQEGKGPILEGEVPEDSTEHPKSPTYAQPHAAPLAVHQVRGGDAGQNGADEHGCNGHGRVGRVHIQAYLLI